MAQDMLRKETAHCYNCQCALAANASEPDDHHEHAGDRYTDVLAATRKPQRFTKGIRSGDLDTAGVTFERHHGDDDVSLAFVH